MKPRKKRLTPQQRELLIRATTFRVTPLADEILSDLEQAYMRLAQASGREEVENAYDVLQQRKKEAYMYIGVLERAARKGARQTVIKRF